MAEVSWIYAVAEMTDPLLGLVAALSLHRSPRKAGVAGMIEMAESAVSQPGVRCLCPSFCGQLHRAEYPGHRLHMVVVQCVSGESLEMELQGSATIYEVKSEVHALWGIVPEVQ